MLKKINKLKNLGLVFRDFKWDPEVPDFKAVNLIYGWNGCGKTTLTRLFDALALGVEGDVEFELEDDSGGKLLQGQKTDFPVKVFNQDYIDRNISIEHSSANTISILLGDENKELAEQVKLDSAKLNGSGVEVGLIEKIKQEELMQNQLVNKTNRIFTDIARTIGAAVAGSSAASRTYRAPDAKRDYAAIAPKSLEEDELELAIGLLRQEVLPEILEVASPVIEADGLTRSSIEVLKENTKQAQILCEQTVAAVAIERLKANPDIAEWVALGMDLHAKHESSNCEYCGNLVSIERLTELANHFNEADREMKRRLDETIADLRLVYSAVDRWRLPDQAQLYPELRESFVVAQKQFDLARAGLVDEIGTLGKILKDKQLSTTVAISLEAVPSTKEISEALEAVNGVLREHNAKTKDFEARQQTALSTVKGHYLSTIQEDIEANNKNLEDGKEKLETLRAEVSETEERLISARAQISSAHKACEVINDGLGSFLGRKELIFSPAKLEEDDKHEIHGYQILRYGAPAVSLSEGEKTAVALIYFLVHLQDGQTPVNETIVVIDDPVSSLDSNSMYQAFSFLKNAIKDCRQAFVFTHNFDFLRQLLNWRSRAQKRTGYYMLKNAMREGQREALICQLDETLQKYETEYLFLFKTLRELVNENDGTILSAYPVPNMARKLWETFIMFRVPVGANTYKRMETLKEEGLDAQKLDSIYKFTNDQSHITGGGLDPCLVPEAEKALASIFEVMKEAAPKHFEHLERSLDA